MQLSLHLPSLFSPPASADPGLPATPVLDRLLARADHVSEPASEPWLHARLGLASPPVIARLLARRDDVAVTGEDLLFAEPVQLVADHRTVHLSPGRTLGLNAIEVASLAGTLDAHFSDLGLRFTASEAGRLYVHCRRADRPQTTPVDIAASMPLIEAQPKSTGQVKWHAVQAEIEMLLHEHPVNTLRDKYGKPRVGGVWFWGEGDEPKAQQAPAFDVVSSDAEWLNQLATEAGIATKLSDWPQNGTARVLVHLEGFENAARLGSAPHFVSALTQLEAGWAAQIDSGLKNGNISMVTLITEADGRRESFGLDASKLAYRFWRRARPISERIKDAAHSHA